MLTEHDPSCCSGPCAYCDEQDIIAFAAKQMADTIRQDRSRKTMTRKMTVESKTENKDGVVFELRAVNKLPFVDDRLTLVIKMGEDEPQWRVGDVVNVEVN